MAGFLSLSGAGSYGYSPAQLPNLELWFEGRFISPAPDDGTDLTTWNEKSNTRNATQSGADNKPHYHDTTTARLINGLPTVQFDGVNDIMEISDFAYTSYNSGFYFFGVIRTGAEPAAEEIILAHYLATGNQRSWLVSRNSDKTMHVILSADGTYGAGADKDYKGGTLDNDTVYLVEFHYDMTTLDLVIDSTTITPTKTNDDAVASLKDSTEDPAIGRIVAGLPYEGDVALLVFGSKSLSDDEKIGMRAYCRNIYDAGS